MAMASETSMGQPAHKRQRLEDSAERTERKDKVLTLIIHWYCCNAADTSCPWNDLYAQELLISHMFNAFKHKRQTINSTGNQTNRQTYMDQEIKITSMKMVNQQLTSVEGKTTMKKMLDHLDKLVQSYGFQYNKGAEWIGMATPILASLSLFKARIEELRMGHTKMPTSKDKSEEISTYGLNPAHGILLEGIRWSPHLRSACASSCGPLTQMICYRQAARQQSGSINYAKKWERVLRESLGHLPTCSDILKSVIHATDDEFRSFMGVLGNVLLFTSSRQNKKVALPMYALLLSIADETRQLYDTKMKSTEDAKYEYVSSISLTLSGKAAVESYNRLKDVILPMTVDPFVTSQLLFHGVFGSYSDNLEALAWITNSTYKWATRAEIGKEFKNMASSTRVMFNPIKIRYYAKPVSSNQSEFYRNTTQQVTTIPTFGGKHVNECGALLAYLEKGNSEMLGTAKGLLNIKSILQGHLDKMRETIQKSRVQKWGNVDWYDLNESKAGVQAPGPFPQRMFMGNYESEVS